MPSTSPMEHARDGALTPAGADTLGAPQGIFQDAPGLHGVGGGTQFGASVRQKLLPVLDHLIKRGTLPPRYPNRVIQVAEYGAVNGRGYPLIQAVIAILAEALMQQPILSLPDKPDKPDPSQPLHFWAMHCDAPGTDFRGLMAALKADPDSYLAPGWAARTPGVADQGVFHSFTDQPFGACVAPRESIDFGLSLMDLHWGHTLSESTCTSDRANAAKADSELSQFLSARAIELRPGAQLVVAYIARGDGTSSSPCTSSFPTAHRLRRVSADMSCPEHVHVGLGSGGGSGGSGARTHSTSDVWSVLSGLLAPSIQRLVSCGMLKADVARFMLTLPLYPRTTAQSVATLRAQKHLWHVDWACGLGEYPSESTAASPVDHFPAHHTTADSSSPSANSTAAACLTPASTSLSASASASASSSSSSSTSSSSSSSPSSSSSSSSSTAFHPPPPAQTPTPLRTDPRSEPEPLRIPHPAWVSYDAGALSRVAYCEHVIALIKNLYEGHWRTLLATRGRMSKGAVAFTLDSIYDVLQTRLDSPDVPLHRIEFEICIYSLRRRPEDR